jgi:molybdopterin-guanine dinucleotide biosynthesis protein A
VTALKHTWAHAGAILIGGRSSRMGRPKHEIVLHDGRTMLTRIATVLSMLCREVVVIGSSEGSTLDGFRCLHDLRPAQTGPLAGIEALLASQMDSQYLVVPCDMPMLTADLLSRLTQPSKALATIARLEHRAQPESLPARISKDALSTVRALLDADQRALWMLMNALPAEIITMSSTLEPQFANVNSPDDLHQLGCP